MERPPDDPTIEADDADPLVQGPGDSEGARPEPPPEEADDAPKDDPAPRDGQG